MKPDILIGIQYITQKTINILQYMEVCNRKLSPSASATALSAARSAFDFLFRLLWLRLLRSTACAALRRACRTTSTAAAPMRERTSLETMKFKRRSSSARLSRHARHAAWEPLDEESLNIFNGGVTQMTMTDKDRHHDCLFKVVT